MAVPSIRIRPENNAPVRAGGRFVLYWMTANRRSRFNYALERAVRWAVDLKKPLVVFEPLNAGLEWTSDRTHRFLLEGMLDNHRAFNRAGALYYPYVERRRGDSKGLLASLGAAACVVVTDRFPDFIYPRLVRAAARQVSVRLESVDSCGLLPLDAAERVFERAYSFRRFLDRNLRRHLQTPPVEDPLCGLPRADALDIDGQVASRWPAAAPDDLRRLASDPRLLDVDHTVPPAGKQGGACAARSALDEFLRAGRPRASGLSPYIHFGQIGVHEIFFEAQQHLKPEFRKTFLDELITWRELGFNMCAGRTDYDQYESLPVWALRTLGSHARDRRPWIYSEEQLEHARTHDPVWNAAQLQLATKGTVHPYLRMLWGKKILEWSPTPQRALAVMIHLNNKYALDGRDPNSYSGIFWVFGRYDRPFGPERPVFGTVRYMSSESARRKLRSRKFIDAYGAGLGADPSDSGEPAELIHQRRRRSA